MDHSNFDERGGGGFWEKMCTVAQNKEIYCKIMKKNSNKTFIHMKKKTCMKEIVQCLPPPPKKKSVLVHPSITIAKNLWLSKLILFKLCSLVYLLFMFMFCLFNVVFICLSFIVYFFYLILSFFLKCLIYGLKQAAISFTLLNYFSTHFCFPFNQHSHPLPQTC